MLFTNDDEATVRSLLTTHEMVKYGRLLSGEGFCVLRAISHAQERDFIVPASHHEMRQLVISRDDPLNTGRPVRLLGHDHPKDGDCLNAWEFGGYWKSAPLEKNEEGDTFTRTTVYAREGKGGA
jgi:hypothetical protein